MEAMLVSGNDTKPSADRLESYAAARYSPGKLQLVGTLMYRHGVSVG